MKKLFLQIVGYSLLFSPLCVPAGGPETTVTVENNTEVAITVNGLSIESGGKEEINVLPVEGVAFLECQCLGLSFRREVSCENGTTVTFDASDE